ncbi:MAG: Methyltransferase type 11 [Candidatus Shapirobacteria bacterium GW2011_GWE1_38_10]|uniref:Methyltransferase type 11 n=1 Tax=Candidatus Shapirobacteria bacterium GW2011_GWE1_38_10 TaxID=1618488 RepID=A0A0G0KHZ2_9BACT|nr:MAG: Methyltransferase type 11 [Candidatus Shapirobacteria bacterium GW2011_GWF2_37_20]KKQ48819.1 MAG: Methyltransferase type 11 [Candidatus Shapirobacteria bacterium GW2011_GWE1_38_10]KKQ63254.1 MAG: Methyltransferase type 11 [Candidatus Shapirobacteria bacterium GW2011_GWF1_38_23]
MRKINLGSGPASCRGWTNYDWGLLPILGKYKLTSIFVKLALLPRDYKWKWPKIELVDIRKGLPDEDKSVDYIYCSNVLEHFEKFEAITILRECKRVLKDRGLIRIVLPDLTKMMKKYKNAESFNREYFGFDKDLYVGILGNIKKLFIRGHQWMYDAEEARELLKIAGFNKIKIMRFGIGACPDIKRLDLKMHQELGLYIEAGN